MSISPAELRKIPLFANITDDHLSELVRAFEPRDVPEGETLFRAGQVPDRFLILAQGEVALEDESGERFRLRPIAPVGELGAITRLPRRLTAVTRAPSTVLSISIVGLMEFCERHGDVAFPLHYNLLTMVADKLRRDQQRIAEMRGNIIITQKAMKRMRDALLEGEDTPLHKQLFDELEGLIEQNKKGRYLVEPSRLLPTHVRLDDGRLKEVNALSRESLRFEVDGAPEPGSAFSGVLVFPDAEFPFSGTIETVIAGHAVIELDLLIDEYARILDDHLTRLQMLDVVL